MSALNVGPKERVVNTGIYNYKLHASPINAAASLSSKRYRKQWKIICFPQYKAAKITVEDMKR